MEGALRSTQPYGPAVSAAVPVVVAAAKALSKVDVTVPPCCFQPPAGYQVDVSGFGGGLPTGTLSVTDQGSGQTLTTVSLAQATALSFRAPIRYNQTGFTTGRAALSDVNADGVLDFIAPGSTSSMEVLLGDSSQPGRFPSATTYGSSQGNGLVTGDFNGDGLPDVAVLLYGTVSSVSLFLNDPQHKGTFLDGGTTELQQAYADIAQADLNGDGLPDLVVVSSQSATVLLNDPSHPGSFVAQTPIPCLSMTNMVSRSLRSPVIRMACRTSCFPRLVRPRQTGVFILYGDSQHPGQFTLTQTDRKLQPAKTLELWCRWQTSTGTASLTWPTLLTVRSSLHFC